MRIASILALLGVGVLSVACSSSSSSNSGSDDPRCVALCTIKEPSTPNAGEICSQASADQCLALCGAEITGVTATCATCLLEDADFGGGESGGSGGDCESPSPNCPSGASYCTDSQNGVSCSYCDDDQAAQDACYAKLNPRTEVACETKFNDVTKCSSFCATK